MLRRGTSRADPRTPDVLLVGPSGPLGAAPAWGGPICSLLSRPHTSAPAAGARPSHSNTPSPALPLPVRGAPPHSLRSGRAANPWAAEGAARPVPACPGPEAPGAQTHLPLPGKPAPCQPSGLRPGRPLITAHACERGDAGRPHAVAALNYDSINPPAHISRASGVHRTPCQAPKRSCTASRSAPARNARPSFSQACKTPSAFLNYENIEV